MSNSRISLESTISQIDDIVASDIEDEKVMMSIEKGEYFGLEPIGSRIWEMMATPVKVSAIIDAMLNQYDIDRQTCENDVLKFLSELNDAGIIRING
ncbi:MAG: lasso peptide biosynthesis PqqD family chaperone [Geobacter sp.]|nr:lasso peptide biosynthesis PqqD family chaperone [Geobacter sp.]